MINLPGDSGEGEEEKRWKKMKLHSRSEFVSRHRAKRHLVTTCMGSGIKWNGWSGELGANWDRLD